MPGKRKIAATKGHSGATGTTGCVFCFSDKDEKETFGTYIKTDTICVHSNCLYFASGLIQRGNDSDGILGFLLPDIQAEVKRGRRLSCAYCKKRGATVGCNLMCCRRSFHLNCGIANASLHQFFGGFLSYCKVHKPKQPKVDINSSSCCICRDPITPDDKDICLYPPCCKQSLFHKTCIQTTALNAGWYYFKCPLCRNKDYFVSQMQFYGINIPIEDASWERDEDAYNELLVRPECDAIFCKCPQGRSYSPAKKSTWGLLVCSDCGGHARHKPCDNLRKSQIKWMCEECSNLSYNVAKNKACIKIEDKACIKIEDKACIKIEGHASSMYKACIKIEDKSGACANNVNMSPKVVLKRMTEIPGIYFDGFSNSNHYNEKLYQSKVTYSKPSKSIDTSKTLKYGKVISSEAVPVAGSSKQVTERLEISSVTTKEVEISSVITKEVSEFFQIPFVTNKLFNRVVNFKDIKNVTHSSPFKQIIKRTIKTKLSRKVCKKLKVDNQSCGISGQALITSYFGHNSEKNIRL